MSHFSDDGNGAAERCAPGPIQRIQQGAFPTRRSHLFTASGTPLRASNFRRRVWYAAVAQIGQEGLRIHDMRHTLASMLIAAGAHPGLVRPGRASVLLGGFLETTKSLAGQRISQ